MAVGFAAALRRTPLWRSAAAPAWLRQPALVAPRCARGKSTAEDGAYGKTRSSGQATLGRTRQQENPAAALVTKKERGFTGLGAHNRALQSLSERLTAPLLGTEAAQVLSGPLQAFRDRRTRLRERAETQQQEDVYAESREFLMTPDTWTFGNMMAYQRKVLELAGGTGWRRKISADDPSILHLEKELRVLEAMTPVELASNHKNVFTVESKKLIAEKAGTTVKYVEQVIMEHDILRADRRWYMILKQFNKPLPKSFEDRQWMGEYDRPFSESEIEYQEEMMEKHQLKTKRDAQPRIRNVYKRPKTRGGDRWSAQPPKWYPAQWRAGPDRKGRLAGVSKGGGGDRGKPWGRLAGHLGA